MCQARASLSDIRLENGTLTARGVLEYEEKADFEAQLHSLMAIRSVSLVIDLSGVRHIDSSYVPCIALAMIDAEKKGKSITIRASPSIARVLRMGALDRLGSIKIDGSGSLAPPGALTKGPAAE